MQQDDERCIHWTGGNSVQVNVSHFEVEVFERALIHASCQFPVSSFNFMLQNTEPNLDVNPKFPF